MTDRVIGSAVLHQEGKEPVELIEQKEEAVEEQLTEEEKQLTEEVSEETPVEEEKKETPVEEKFNPDEYKKEIFNGLGVESEDDIKNRFTKLQELESLIGDRKDMVELINYLNQNGSLKEYIQYDSIDVDSMRDIDRVRLKFDHDNADLPVKVRDALWEKEQQKYPDTAGEEYTEQDVLIGQAQLKRDADAATKFFKEQKDKFKLPDPVQQPSEEEIKAQQQAEIDKQVSQIKSEPLVAKVLQDKKISVDLGSGDPLIMDMESPDAVVDYAVNMNNAAAAFTDEKGGINWDKWNQTVLFMQDPQRFIQNIVNHVKSQSLEEIDQKINNPAPSRTTLPDGKEAIDTSTRAGLIANAKKTARVVKN